jgi:hypothetical protein
LRGNDGSGEQLPAERQFPAALPVGKKAEVADARLTNGCSVTEDGLPTKQPTSFVHQEILALLELMKRGPINVTEKDFQRCGTRSASGFKKSTYIRPASVNSMGGYYTARAQRVDMLD